MSARARQLVLLGILAAAALMLLQQIDFGSAAGEAGGLFGDASAPGAVGGRQAEVASVALELLEGRTGQYSPGRDPFRFAAVQPAAPPPPPPPPPQPQPAPRAPRPQQQTPPGPPKPRPPPIDFVFLGSFGPEDSKIGVFTDTSDIYNARVGDVIKESFVVVQIGYESADVGFVGFPQEPASRLAAGG